MSSKKLARTVLLACALLAAGLVASPRARAATTTQTFTTFGCGNTIPANLFTVPSGVTTVTIQATGSAGYTDFDLLAPGGTGDVVSGTLSGLSAEQTLDVCVNVGGGVGGAGNGTSPGGGPGGGASGVALGSDFTQPVLIAAGGGGGGAGSFGGGSAEYGGAGGGAGNPSGGGGSNGSADTGNTANGGEGGGGGTQTAFGMGGSISGQNGAAFTSGSPGTGGGGGYAPGPGGGGGGAGYFGGGGGGSAESGGAGGGGGGSDFCATTTLPSPVVVSGCAVSATPNTVFFAASVTITYTTEPETTIVSDPFDSTKDDTPTFSFTSDTAGARFECSVDGADFMPCTSPFTTSRLKRNRSHNFLVRAIADGAVDPTPATQTFTVTRAGRGGGGGAA